MLSGGLLGIFNRETTPTFTPSRCLNRRNRFEPCVLCSDACPSGALKLDTGLLSIEEKKCTGCGICAAACPSEALQLKDYQLFRHIAGRNDMAELRCLKSGGIYCLKSLSPALLAALILFKAEQSIVCVMPCQDCELSDKTESKNMDVALDFMRTIDVRPKIEINRDATFEREVSRRELLTSFMTWGRERGKNLLEDALWHDGNDVFLARQFLSDRMDSIKDGCREIVLHEGIFHDFDVSDACDGCGFCEGICPTRAWSVRRSIKDEGEQETELRFNMKECVGCGLCARKCPGSAIKPAEEFPWRSKGVLKKRFPMSRCRHCGMWFIQSNREQELCESCSRHYK